MAPEDVGYPDSVARSGGAHPGDQANKAEDARKVEGLDGKNNPEKPIGPQSGFTPLMSSQKAHGDANTEESARKESGRDF